MEPPLNSISFSILGAESNVPGYQYGYYRILTASSAIKYLSFLPSKPPFPKFVDDRRDGFGFTTVPGGDWNIGRLEKDLKTGRVVLQSTEKVALQSVEDVWHPARVDYLSLGDELPRDELQCAGQMNSAIYPGQLGADQVVVNTDWYPDWIHGVIQETMVYSQIEGHGIGPKFLAHVTENEERVYGYMLERVQARHATIDDLQACKTVLAKLHSLEIVYGSLSSDSFLILENGQALLHCFGGSFATDHKPLFEREMQSVEDVLRRGFPEIGEGMSVEVRAEISAIYERDDGIHPEVMRQAAEDGKITITAEEHRALLRILREELRELRSHQKSFNGTGN